jgi:hypothetical protein
MAMFDGLFNRTPNSPAPMQRSAAELAGGPSKPAAAPGQGGDNGQVQKNTNNTPTNANSPESMQDPVAMYADLWKESAPQAGSEAPKFTLNPETVKKVTDSLDFTQGLPEEITEKITAGEQFTPQDMMNMMNHVGRQAYARAMEHQSTLTGQFVNMHSEHSLKGLPNIIKGHLAQNKVRNHPAAQSNPVVQEHMELIASKLSAKYPNASEEWITEQTQDYFVNMARRLKPDAFVPSAEEQKQQQQNPKGTVDWDAFMTEDRQVGNR